MTPDLLNPTRFTNVGGEGFRLPSKATKVMDAHPDGLLFVTISGAHLYGFASPDSDYDLRGCHVAPLREVVRLNPPNETYEVMDRSDAVEVDLVTHDVRKFFSLLLKNNGYVLEQVCSPLVVMSTPAFQELLAIAPRCITRNHMHHFMSFGESQWKLVTRRPRVKGLLYTYRVLLAGIHLMRTGRVESNLRTLNETFGLGSIDELISRKIEGEEKQELRGSELERHEAEFLRLCSELASAREASHLPEMPSCRAEIDDLLVRVRLAQQGRHPA